jgi:hypothetical protein
MTGDAIELIWQARERLDKHPYAGSREQFFRAAMYWAQYDPRRNKLESLVEAAALLVAAIECAMGEAKDGA